MNKKLILIIAAMFVSLSAFAQVGGVRAKVVSRSGRVPVPAAEVVVSQDGEQVVKTQSADDGNFVIENLQDGDYLLTVTSGCGLACFTSSAPNT